jgi:hypothetical protein
MPASRGRSPARFDEVFRTYLLEEEAAPPDPLEAADPPLPPLLLAADPPPPLDVPPVLPELELEEDDLVAPPPPGTTVVLLFCSHAPSAKPPSRIRTGRCAFTASSPRDWHRARGKACAERAVMTRSFRHK